MSASKLSESKIVLLSVIINFICEKSLSTTASDCGTNKYNNNSFLIFARATSITESPSKSSTVNGDYFFSWITCNSLSISFIVFCDLCFWLLLMLRETCFFPIQKFYLPTPNDECIHSFYILHIQLKRFPCTV